MDRFSLVLGKSHFTPSPLKVAKKALDDGQSLLDNKAGKEPFLFT